MSTPTSTSAQPSCTVEALPPTTSGHPLADDLFIVGDCVPVSTAPAEAPATGTTVEVVPTSAVPAATSTDAGAGHGVDPLLVVLLLLAAVIAAVAATVAATRNRGGHR